MLEAGELGDDNLEIFLNALVGVTTPQTMQVTATIRKFPLTTLIDTRSNHNFLHESFAKLAGLPIETNSSLRVIVANGEKLRSLSVLGGHLKCAKFSIPSGFLFN